MLELFLWSWLLLVTLAFIVWICTPATKPQVSSPLYDAEFFYEREKKGWPALDSNKGLPYIQITGSEVLPPTGASR